MRDFLRRARGWLTGLSAISARFDLLQNRIDALVGASERTNAALADLARGLASEANRRRIAEQAQALTLSDHDGRLRGIAADLTAMSMLLDAIGRCAVELPGTPEWNAIASCINAWRGAVEAEQSAGHKTGHFPAQPSGLSTHLHSGDAEGRGLAFLLQSLELVNHYAAVWDLLPPGGFDVLLHGVDETAGRQALVGWRCGVFATENVLAEGRKYVCLVSNHPVEVSEEPLIKRLAERNVRFMYAAGKSGWNLSEWNRLYDLILCFGPHHAAAFSACTDGLVIQMGYPRFDRYFNEQVDRNALCGRFGCDPAKETVVWLPTWKELSSVGHFDDEISALMDRYNVVVKLHPLMSEGEPTRVESLRSHKFSCLLTDSTDNLPLYQLADYMLFDFGGPPLAAIYCDKKMLLLDVPGALSDPLLAPDSPDVAIRAQLGSIELRGGAIARCLASSAHWEAQVPIRKALRRTYFAPYFGFSAMVAANSLVRLDTLLAGAGLD